MIKEIKFKKRRILLGILFSFTMFLISILFLIKPDFFIRSFFRTAEFIQIIGIIGIVFFPALTYSFSKLLKRKFALRITEFYLIDNSRYGSYGKIEWKEISYIRRIERNSIELFMDPSFFQNRKMNLLGKFLLFMNNWNYKESVIISSALQECSIEELYQDIINGYENHKKQNTIELHFI